MRAKKALNKMRSSSNGKHLTLGDVSRWQIGPKWHHRPEKSVTWTLKISKILSSAFKNRLQRRNSRNTALRSTGWFVVNFCNMAANLHAVHELDVREFYAANTFLNTIACPATGLRQITVGRNWTARRRSELLSYCRNLLGHHSVRYMTWEYSRA